MVVDDESSLLMLLKTILSGAGHTVKCASRGQEAISILAQEAAGEEEKFDLVITDMNLSGRLSGLEVAAEAKKNHPARPVIAISGLAVSPPSKDIDLFLRKPIISQELLRFIKRHLPPSAES